MNSMRAVFSAHGSITSILLELVRSNRQGVPVGIYSVCSANPYVLEAGILQAQAGESLVCVESTSNQVNQFGGYTGMTPAQFAAFVAETAARMGFRFEHVVLGGDHLGPHVWQREPARDAMAKASALVEACVLAGYVKIHLDTSMRCADDPGGPDAPLADETVMERAAQLCAAAEAAHARMPEGTPSPLYVIGTEVPAPGGEQAEGAAPLVTRPDHVRHTIELGRRCFAGRGLQKAWQRVIALVVQPGVEFGDSVIFDYDRESAQPLSRSIVDGCELVYEAHSTDYQRPDRLAQMVEDHFAILKVGPWLTFAFREAVFALEAMEREFLGAHRGVALSGVSECLEQAMMRNPVHWRGYYKGDAEALRFARKYSYSDRSRYYWPDAAVQRALSHLFRNLKQNPVPLNLLSQFMPAQYAAIREASLTNDPESLVRHRILQVTGAYAHACRMV